MTAENRADRAVEIFLANLLIQIAASIKTDPSFRPEIVYDLNNPNSVILLVRCAMRDLEILGQKTAKPRQNSELITTRSTQKPEVGFQAHTEALYRSAERRVITYMPDDGVHFIDDAELEPIRRVFALIGRQE